MSAGQEEAFRLLIRWIFEVRLERILEKSGVDIALLGYEETGVHVSLQGIIAHGKQRLLGHSPLSLAYSRYSGSVSFDFDPISFKPTDVKAFALGSSFVERLTADPSVTLSVFVHELTHLYNIDHFVNLPRYWFRTGLEERRASLSQLQLLALLEEDSRGLVAGARESFATGLQPDVQDFWVDAIAQLDHDLIFKLDEVSFSVDPRSITAKPIAAALRELTSIGAKIHQEISHKVKMVLSLETVNTPEIQRSYWMLRSFLREGTNHGIRLLERARAVSVLEKKIVRLAESALLRTLTRIEELTRVMQSAEFQEQAGFCLVKFVPVWPEEFWLWLRDSQGFDSKDAGTVVDLVWESSRSYEQSAIVTGF